MKSHHTPSSIRTPPGYLDNETGPLSMSVRGEDEKFLAAKTRSKVGREYISRDPLSRYTTAQCVSIRKGVGPEGVAS